MSPQTLFLLVQLEHSANQVSSQVHMRRGGGVSVKPAVAVGPVRD